MKQQQAVQTPDHLQKEATQQEEKKGFFPWLSRVWNSITSHISAWFSTAVTWFSKNILGKKPTETEIDPTTTSSSHNGVEEPAEPAVTPTPPVVRFAATPAACDHNPRTPCCPGKKFAVAHLRNTFHPREHAVVPHTGTQPTPLQQQGWGDLLRTDTLSEEALASVWNDASRCVALMLQPFLDKQSKAISKELNKKKPNTDQLSSENGLYRVMAQGDWRRFLDEKQTFKEQSDPCAMKAVGLKCLRDMKAIDCPALKEVPEEQLTYEVGALFAVEIGQLGMNQIHNPGLISAVDQRDIAKHLLCEKNKGNLPPARSACTAEACAQSKKSKKTQPKT